MDIVERLREFDSVPDADVILIINEAADEIERLRKALIDIASARIGDAAYLQKIANDALNGDKAE